MRRKRTLITISWCYNAAKIPIWILEKATQLSCISTYFRTYFLFTLIFKVFLLQYFSQNFLNPCFSDSSKWYPTWKFSGNIITQQAVAGDHTQKIFFAETICIAASWSLVSYTAIRAAICRTTGCCCWQGHKLRKSANHAQKSYFSR